MTTLKTFARRVLFPDSHARELEERRLEQMMGFHGQYRTHRDFQVKFLTDRGLTAQPRLLEVGCGPLTLGIPIVEHLDAGGYTGVDVRPLIVNEAHQLIAQHQLGTKNPRIIHSTTFGRDELGQETFDVIVSFSVLYHLNDELVAQLFSEIPKRLAPGGVFYANINTAHEPSQWLEFPFLQREVDFYANLAAPEGLEVQVLGQGKDLGLVESDAACFNHYLAFRAKSTAN